MCPRCGSDDYERVDTRPSTSSVLSGRIHGQQAGKALAGGHPAAAAAALIGPLVGLA